MHQAAVILLLAITTVVASTASTVAVVRPLAVMRHRPISTLATESLEPGGRYRNALSRVLEMQGDLNFDKRIDESDVTIIQAAMDSMSGDANYNRDADLDRDGEITSSDLATLMANFTNSNMISGMVELEDYVPGPAGIQAVVDIDNTGGVGVTLDAFGRFSVGYRPGPGRYEFGVRGPHWVRSAVPGIALTGRALWLGKVRLTNGDADGNGVIDNEDLDIWMRAQGTSLGQEGWNAQADLDGNDVVTINDLSVLYEGIAREGCSPAMLRFTADPTQVYPGDNITLTVELVTTTATVLGLDYKVGVSDGGEGFFRLAGRDLTDSVFTDLVMSNTIVLRSSYSLIDPMNAKPLSALVNPLSPTGPGTMRISTLTIHCEDTASPGTYRLIPFTFCVVGGDSTSLDNLTVQAATIEVLDGEGMMMMEGGFNGGLATLEELGSIKVEEPSLNDKLRAWLVEHVGADWSTFDPENPPEGMTELDAMEAYFYIYCLENGIYDGV